MSTKSNVQRSRENRAKLKNTNTKTSTNERNKSDSRTLNNVERSRRYRLKNSIGFDTFESDLTSLGDSLNGIYNGWQTAETMNNTRASVESMYGRLGAYEDYRKQYGNENLPDLSELHGAYKSALDGWDDQTALYGQYKNADAFNTAKSLRENISSMTSADIQPYLRDKNNRIAYTTATGENITWEKLYNEKKRAEVITDITSREDFEKYRDIGANAENPDFWDVQSANMGVTGWFKKDLEIPNIAKYSRDNRDELLEAMADRSAVAGGMHDFYNQMTDEEYGVYNYLLGQDLSSPEGTKSTKAKEYAKFLWDELEARANNEVINATAKIAEDLPISSSAASVLLTPISAMESIKNLVTNEAKTNMSSAMKSAIRGTVSDNYDLKIGEWDAFDFVYNTVMSGADSMAMASFGNVGGVVLGLDAAGQATNEALKRGLSNDEALKTGFMAGAFEALFESLSIGQFNAFKDAPVDGIQEALKNLGKTMFVNASEEALTEVANIAYDRLVNTDLSQYETDIRKYIASGMSESEAKKKVALEATGQVIEAAGSGGLMGVGFGTVANVSAYNKSNKTGQDIRSAEQVGNVFEIASMSPEESQAYEAYTRYANNGITAENATNAQVGSLYNMVNSKVKGEFLPDYYDMESSKQRIAEQKRIREDEATSEEDKNKATQKLDEAISDYTDAQKRMSKNLGYAKVAHKLLEIDDKVSDKKYIAKTKAEAKKISADVETSVMAESNEAVDFKGVEFDGKDTNIITNDGKVSINDVKLSETDAHLITIAKDMDARVASAFVSVYDRSTNVDLEQYLNDFNLVSGYAVNERYTPTYILQHKGSLTEKQAVIIADISKEIARQKEVEFNKLLETTANNTPYKGVINDSIFKNGTVNYNRLDKRQKNAIQFLKVFAAKSGMNLTFEPEYENTNGWFDKKTNTLHISVGAGIKRSEGMLKDTIIPTASHEITHWMEEKSLELWEKLKNVALDALEAAYKAETGKDITQADIIASEVKRLDTKHSGKKHTADDAVREIVARCCEDMLSMSEEGRKMFDTMSEAEQKTFKEKVMEIINNLKEWINEFLSSYGTQTEEAKLLRNYKEKLEEMSKIWDEMLVRSVEVNQAIEKSKTAENKDTTSNEEQHSDKDSEGNVLTKEQLIYFADSKVRDENGNLKVMYRGDANEFTVFDRKKSKASNLYGRGFYFTDSKSHAEQYGKATAYYLDIKNPLSPGQHSITKAQTLKFLKAIENDGEDYDLYNYGEGATAESVLKMVWGKDDFAMLQDINAGAIGDLVAAVELFNEVNGTHYDGLILPTETVTFASEQAKLTSNKKPTNNPDIQYSDKVTEITEDDYKNIKDHFGTTGNYNVAGYMLTDGKMLDFSGKHWGDTTSTFRQVDHRDIQEALDDDENGVEAMVRMIGNGNIRLMPETGGINLAVAPSKNQRIVLRRYIEYMSRKEGVIVDIDKVGGDTIKSFEYDKGVSADRVMRDIDNYFKGGSQSELMRFHTMGDGVQFSEKDYPIDAEIAGAVKRALSHPNGKKKFLCTITPFLSKKINEEGVRAKNDFYKGKYEGGKHIFSDYALKHSMAEHGDFLREALRAQLPMTPTDIARHLSALKDGKYPKDVILSRTEEGYPSIITVYEVNGYTLYAEEIKKPLGSNNASDLIGHTMYKAPTLPTAAFGTTSVQTQPKRQSMVLCEYYTPNNTKLSRGKFVSNEYNKPALLYYTTEKGLAKHDERSGGLIALSSNPSNFTNKSAPVEQGYVVCKKPFLITQKRKIFTKSKDDVSDRINELKKEGYDCFIFDKTVGDNYMVAVVNKAQIVKAEPTVISDSDMQHSDKDSSGNILTKEQQNYFADSKVRDENGNLKVMYHGSQNAGFHVFNNKFSDDKISFFFTDSHSTAESYSGTNEIYEARTFKTVDDFNNFFAEIGAEDYEVKKENGKFVLYDDGDEVATSDNAKGLYDEFTDYTGLGQGAGNYKVYLNLKNPLIVNANNENWSAIKVPKELQKDMHLPYANTRQFAEYAKDKGFDGVIINGVYDNGSYSSGTIKPNNVAIAFESNQIKSVANTNPTEDDDIRYSDKDTTSVYDVMGETERLRSENEQLRKDFADLQERLELEKQLTHGNYFNENSLGTVAGHLRNISNSSYDKVSLIGRLKEVYSYIAHSENVTWDEMFDMSYRIAEDMLKESKPDVVVNREYKRILNEIRNTKISLDATQISEAKYRFGNNYNRAFFNKVHLTSEGISLDTMWQDWAERYPDFFDASVSSGNQIGELYDIIESLQEASEIVEEYDMEEQARWLATEIYNQYWNVSTIKTTADKYDRKIKLLNYQHRNRMNALRDSYNERVEKLKGKNRADREKYKKLVKEIRESKDKKVAEAKALGKKRMTEYKESVERKSRIQSITANTLTLADWYVTNSKDKHIPEVLKGPVKNLIDAIDFSSKRLLDKNIPTQKDISLAKALNKVRNMMIDASKGNADLVQLYGHNLDEDIEKMMDSIDMMDRTIADNEYILQKMSLEDLATLDKMVKAIKASVSKMNKFHIVNHAKGIASLSQTAMVEMDKLGKAKVYEGLRGKIDKTLMWNNAIPVYAFKRFGEAGTKVFEALQDGWDKFAFNVKKILDFAEKTYTSKEVEEWEATVKTFDIRVPATEDDLANPDYKPQFQKVQMTIPQIMSLHCLYKREQAKQHLIGGGIRVADFTVGNKVISQTDGLVFTKENVETIISTLSRRQVEVADKIQEFMNTVCSEWGNEVSMARFGIRQFGEENYFPIQSDKNNLAVDDETEKANSLFRLLNMSFSKSLTPGADNRIVISNIFDVFAQHSSDMAKYNALALPVLDTFRWYNYTEKHEVGDDAIKTNGVKQAMEKAFGSDGKNYFTTFLKDINGQKEVSRDTLGAGLFTNAKIAAVGANLRVVLLQPTSYVRASAIIDNKYLTKALMFKPKTDKAQEHCGIAQWKALGYYDTNIQKGVADQIKGVKTWKDKAQEWSMWGAEKADSLTWGYLWNACELEIRDTRKDLKVGSKEFYDAISKRLREVIYTTQVVDSTMTRSQMMRSGQLYDKMLASFASEPTLAYNMVVDAYVQFSLDKRKMSKGEAWRKNRTHIARVASAYIMTNAVAALVESAFDAYRDDDDEEKDLVYFMRTYFSNFAQDMSLVGKIPYIKDMVSIFQGYGASRTDIAWMESLYKALTGTWKLFTSDSTNPGKVAKNWIKFVSSAKGLPLYNIYRDTKLEKLITEIFEENS